MPSRVEFNDLESRMDAVEKTIVEMQTLIKILKPIAVLLGLSLGIDFSGMVL